MYENVLLIMSSTINAIIKFLQKSVNKVITIITTSFISEVYGLTADAPYGTCICPCVIEYTINIILSIRVLGIDICNQIIFLY